MKKILLILTLLLPFTCSKGDFLSQHKGEIVIDSIFYEPKRSQARFIYYLKNQKTNVHIYLLDSNGWSYFRKIDYEYAVSLEE